MPSYSCFHLQGRRLQIEFSVPCKPQIICRYILFWSRVRLRRWTFTHSSADTGHSWRVSLMFRVILPSWKSLASRRHSFRYFLNMTFSLPYLSNCPVPVTVDNGIAQRTSRCVPQCHSPIALGTQQKGPLSPSSSEPLSPTLSTQLMVLPGFRPTSCRGGLWWGGLRGGRAVVDKRIALISKAANLTRSSTVRKSLSTFFDIVKSVARRKCDIMQNLHYPRVTAPCTRVRPIVALL
jgi:hypothetical protein